MAIKGNTNKRKGSRYERKCAQLHQDFGIDCYRVPNSGARTDGPTKTDPGDIVIEHTRRPLVLEVKYSSTCSGFKRAYDWVQPGWGVILPASRLVLFEFKDWLDIALAYQQGVERAEPIITREKGVAKQRTLCKMIDDHDVLLTRGPRKPWLAWMRTKFLG